ncbi:MAG: hypothetical protein ACK4P8_02030 [Tabrizicola sp.]
MPGRNSSQGFGTVLLKVTGDQALATGAPALRRRDPGIGQSLGDETPLGFPGSIGIALTARRAP